MTDKKVHHIDTGANPFKLTLDRNAEGLEQIFSTISKERIDEILDAIMILETTLYSAVDYTPQHFIHDALHSDIAKTQEELLFLCAAITGMVALQAHHVEAHSPAKILAGGIDVAALARGIQHHVHNGKKDKKEPN